MMRINDLAPLKNARKKKKRVGRGPGSGHGKTSCRGHKGQNSRSGGGTPPGFEGGQMPLQRRLPKRGFTNIFKKEYTLINIKDLKHFEANANIDVQVLENKGFIRNTKEVVKLLGAGEVTHPLFIKVHKASKSAINKVEAVGGKIELI
jgi:large subunit ribosomal protein L15